MADAAANRFVIHHHAGHGPEHWDLMLEDGDVLATWRLDRPPTSADDEPIPARRIFDHRKAFLTYEGPISADRGHVTIVESGAYTTVQRTDDTWTFCLRGKRLEGRFILRSLPAESEEPEGWELSRRPRMKARPRR